MNLFNAGSGIYRHRKLVHVPTPSGLIPTRFSELTKVSLRAEGDEVRLSVPVVTATKGPWWRYESGKEILQLTGMDAVRAAGALLPSLNSGGGSADEVSRAVGYLDEAPDAVQLYRRAAESIAEAQGKRFFGMRYDNALRRLPTAGRLALEMAAHEDTERRALEGELHILEEAWKQAEEIAGIADDLFLPESVEKDLARLRSERGDKTEG
jgi:hypothetical protein